MKEARLQPSATEVRRCAVAGITLIETVLSLLILGGAFVAALNTIASARGAQGVLTQQQLGLTLAEDLMDEVLSQSVYHDGVSFGPESGELTAGRGAFDALDDYHGWFSSPPTDAMGRDIPGATGYSRQIEMRYVQLADVAQVSSKDQGVVRITVRVKFGEKDVATLTAYRTDRWRAPQEVK